MTLVILINRLHPSKPSSLRRQQALVFRSLNNCSFLLTSLVDSFTPPLSISGRAPGRIRFPWTCQQFRILSGRVFFFSWLDRNFQSPLPRDGVSRRSLCRTFFPRDRGMAFHWTLKLLLFFVFLSVFPFCKSLMSSSG